MGPSRTNGAVTVSQRKAATKVVDFQCPCEAAPRQRSPRGARSRLGVIAVWTQVWSMNTSRVGSQLPWSYCHSCRACFTSARSCSLACSVYFKAQLPLVQLMPQRWRLDRDTLTLGQALAQLGQGQIRLRLDPSPHRCFQMGDPGDAISAHRSTAALAHFEKARPDLVDRSDLG
jgi:hypothetical protein